jgi:ABC-type transport system involved in cytochrome c biogenesis permease subunit
MATEMARYAFYGMIIGAVVFSILFGYYYFGAIRMTDQEKADLNNAYAQNCTKCLERENISCTVDTLQYSSFGAICDLKYVSRNCTSCKKI